MKLNLTIDEQIAYLNGIINAKDRNLDEYERILYKTNFKEL